MDKIKQFFCSHIYQKVKSLSLNKFQQFTYNYPENLEGWVKFEDMAEFKTCLKCGKDIIVKVRYVVQQ